MLIVSGSSAEQPSPARAKAPTDASGAGLGSTAITRNAPASRNGRMWYVARLGSQRWIAANSTRPAVTTAQNAVSATAAVVDTTPSEVMSSWDQLPFMVSQNPYRIANAPNSQSPAGIRAPGDPAAGCGAASGLGAGRSGRPASRAAARIGRPVQNPMPTNIATNTGASAVPSPSRAFSTSTDRSTACGWNAAASVFSAGTARPKPAPRQAVAASSSP